MINKKEEVEEEKQNVEYLLVFFCLTDSSIIFCTDVSFLYLFEYLLLIEKIPNVLIDKSIILDS